MSKQIQHNLNEGNGGRPKIEPKSFAVSLEDVFELGTAQYCDEPDPANPMHEGPGYSNNSGAGRRQTLPKGSQGSHK